MRRNKRLSGWEAAQEWKMVDGEWKSEGRRATTVQLVRSLALAIFHFS
jgi:hypothetical protein